MIAVTEGNAASAETSAADEKPAPETTTPETRDNIEMAVFKVTEKDTVAFAKASVSITNVHIDVIILFTSAFIIWRS